MFFSHGCFPFSHSTRDARSRLLVAPIENLALAPPDTTNNCVPSFPLPHTLYHISSLFRARPRAFSPSLHLNFTQRVFLAHTNTKGVRSMQKRSVWKKPTSRVGRNKEKSSLTSACAAPQLTVQAVPGRATEFAGVIRYIHTLARCTLGEWGGRALRLH